MTLPTRPGSADALRWRRLAPFVAVALVASTPLLLDGATALTATMATTAGLLGLLAALGGSRGRGASTAAIWLGTLVCVITAWTLVPIPQAVLEALGSTDHDALARRALVLLGARADPRSTLAVDPGATERAVATAAGCLAALLTGTLVARARGASFVLGGVGFAAALVALVTFAHAGVGATRIYGIYTPATPHAGWPSPILNNNHLAGLMALAIPCLLALARRTDRVAVRTTAILAALTAAAMGIFSHSRSGALAVLVSLTASVVILLRDKRRSDASTHIVRLAVPLVLVPTALLLVVLEGSAFVADFRDEPYKTDLIVRSLAFARDQGPFGVGRGGFAAAFASLTGPHGRATYPENIVAQWLAEFGPFVGTALLAAFVFVVGSAHFARGAGTAERLGALGIAALALQNLGDYSLEMPGIAMSASLALGAVTARRVDRPNVPDAPTEGETSLERFQRGARLVPSSVALLFASLFLPLAYRDDLVLQLVARAHASRRAALDADAWAAVVTAHPLEPTVYLALASQARGVDAASTLGFINLARRAAPKWHAPHVEAYLYLAQHHRTSQAIAEIAALTESSAELGARVTCLVAPRTFEPERWVRAVPVDDSARFVVELGRCVAAPTRLELARLAARDRPSDDTLAAALVHLTLQVEGPAAARDALDRATQRLGGHVGFDVLAARIALQADAPAEALRALDAARNAGRSSVDFDELEALAASRLGDAPRTERALARVERRMQTLSATASLERLRARCEIQLRRPDRAMDALEAAYAADPAPDLLVELARMATEQSRPLRSENAKRRLCLDFPNSRECLTSAGTPSRP